MRCKKQISSYALHRHLARWLQIVIGWSVHFPFPRSSYVLSGRSAFKRRIFVGHCLSEILVLAVFVRGQQLTEARSGLALPNAPILQQPFSNALEADYSPGRPSRTALSRANGGDPGFPGSDACANPAEPADRRSQTEWSFGKKLAAEVEGRVALVSEPGLNEYLNRLLQTIVLNSHLRGCFTLKVVNDVEANAYSFPGGFLYVTTAMILSAENEAQLIATLAHETGHVAARHLTKIVARKRIWMICSVAGGPVGYALGQRLAPLFVLKLSRNAEFEADGLALKYLAASGYDPTELAGLLQHAFQQEGKPESFLARLFDTHPPTDIRVRRLSRAAGRLLTATDYIVDTNEFHEVQNQVAELMGVTVSGFHRNIIAGDETKESD